MKDWVVTIPKKIPWTDYLDEVADAHVRGLALNYHVHRAPPDLRPGDRCYLVWNGYLRGWMRVSGINRLAEDWKCESTGKIWPAGTYIAREPVLHRLMGTPVPMKGFRGIRRLNNL